jgi:hypothetical protein
MLLRRSEQRRACLKVVQQARRVTQEEHNDLLSFWGEQVKQARRGQEASWSLAQVLAQESADAYEDFLESVFFYYRENARATKKDSTPRRS